MDRWVRGKRFRESAGRTEAEAKRKLRRRHREIQGDRFVGPAEERLTVEELLDNLILHLKTKGARAISSYESHLLPVREFFALTQVVDLSTAQLERFIRARLKEGKRPATVNRSTGALRQALNLARRQGRITRGPFIPMLNEDNARQGFFERGDFEAVKANLPAPVADISQFAYLSGWRKGEILSLSWDMVDRMAREIRLPTSKNGRGRVLPLEGKLWELIERRWKAREIKGNKEGVTCLADSVFHNGKDGNPITDFKKSWVSACNAAKVPGKLFHDLRRTAVRNMIRAGVPQSVAMAISGHRTVSMFLRYNIASEEDKREAIRKVDAHLGTISMKRNVVPILSRRKEAE